MGRNGPWLVVLAVGAGLIAGCDRHDDGRGGEPQTGAAAAGGSVDVEYLLPQRFDDVLDPARMVFPAKFVCGEAEAGDWHAPGSYSTLINVLNMSRRPLNVQWWFTTFEKAQIPGATAEVLGKGTIVMPCEFILRNLLQAGLDVGGVTEGFVLLEAQIDDPSPAHSIQVAVVYSYLHKQRHDLPDLVPVEKDPGYCTVDDQNRLVVTVGNIGERPAGGSMARISIVGQPEVERSTPDLAPGAEAQLDPVELPDVEGRIVFTIAADSEGAITESSETNNFAIGSCQIVE